MKQPHVYVLPQRFIDDPSVPLKWKLYCLINGFWVSGKPVFASNDYFSEKLGCSDRHVRDCLLELEKMFLITRHGKSQNRRIIPGGHGGGTGSSAHVDKGGTLSVVREELGVPHSIYYISTKDRDHHEPKVSDETERKEDQRIELHDISEDGEILPTKKGKTTTRGGSARLSSLGVALIQTLKDEQGLDFLDRGTNIKEVAEYIPLFKTALIGTGYTAEELNDEEIIKNFRALVRRLSKDSFESQNMTSFHYLKSRINSHFKKLR